MRITQKKLGIYLFSLSFLILFAGCGEKSKGKTSENIGLELGAAIPAFELTDDEGNKRTEKDFYGKVLLFASSTCGYCGELLQGIKGMGKSDFGTEIAIMHRGDGVGENQVMKQDYQLGLTVLASDHATFKSFGIKYTPFAYKISKSGEIEAKKVVGSKEKLLEFAQ